ncbi:MAG: YggT family protein [Alphaproteobacteria bacterium]|nr:YggT family protein [Alphaproteobacteria bacterium]
MQSLLLLIDTVLSLFNWALIIYIVLSLLINFNVINGYQQFVAIVYQSLSRICEPFLRPIRRLLPEMGGVDLSPMIIILLIFFLRSLLVEYAPLLLR